MTQPAKLGVAALGVALLVLGSGAMRGWGRPRVSQAWAQSQTMEFKPVPPESAEALERRSGRHPSSIPAPPATPEPPSPPVVTRSGDITRIGSDIHIGKDEVVDGSVIAIQGDVRVDGHVRGSVSSTGGDVYLSSTARVDGDVVSIGGELHEEPGASVGGQRSTVLNMTRERHLRRLDGRLRDRLREDIEEQTGHAAALVARMAWLLIWLGIAWGVTRFAPVRTSTAVDMLRREPGMSLLVGFLTALLLAPSLVALALVAAILCITIIGIPLAVGALLGYVALLVVVCVWGVLIGVVPVGQFVGARLAARSSAAPQPLSLLRAAVYGVIAIEGTRVIGEAFHFVPFLGWVGTLIKVVWWISGSLILMFGAGALMRSKFGQGPGGRWWPLRPARPVDSSGSGPVAQPSPGPAAAGAPAAPESTSPPPPGGAWAPPDPSGAAPPSPPAPTVQPSPWAPPDPGAPGPA